MPTTENSACPLVTPLFRLYLRFPPNESHVEGSRSCIQEGQEAQLSSDAERITKVVEYPAASNSGV